MSPSHGETQIYTVHALCIPSNLSVTKNNSSWFSNIPMSFYFKTKFKFSVVKTPRMLSSDGDLSPNCCSPICCDERHHIGLRKKGSRQTKASEQYWRAVPLFFCIAFLNYLEKVSLTSWAALWEFKQFCGLGAHRGSTALFTYIQYVPPKHTVKKRITPPRGALISSFFSLLLPQWHNVVSLFGRKYR
jgi:hypothetical protein